MKRLIYMISVCLFLTGCGQNSITHDTKLHIVASLFPQYDFAREICGDKAEISLLLPAGTESHSYDPTPSDVICISKADLFLYTGDKMEPWVSRLKEHCTGQVVNVSEGISLLDGGHIHETHEEADASATTDPHIWTNPQNAIRIVDTICIAVSNADSENVDYYKANAERYKEKLRALDDEFKTTCQNGKRNKIFFGGHFALRYFTEAYNLSYVSAFDACNGETEPSPYRLTEMMQAIRDENIPVVYYEELSTPRTAALLCEETGAEMLLFHSCHNIAKGEENETYLTLMYKNLENLKIGLN